eukprot:scaffold26503_cov127-Cylindrotheca_fusiformis.AAC.2
MISNVTTISVAVPEGAEHGDVLTFMTADGQQEIEIPVPFGSKEGDVLQVQVALDTPSSNCSPVNDSMIFDLGDGHVLKLTSRLPQELNASAEASADEATSNDGTFPLPWQSGIELARCWDKIPIDVNPKRVLELGSGAMGLVGMSFAAKLREKLADSAVVVLTDIPAAIPLLTFNIEHNLSSLPSNLIQARPLRWSLESDDESSTGEPPYDCLLGSDLLYNAEYIPHLVATAKRLLHPTKGIFLLAVRWRKPDLERDFFRETGLEWELVSSVGGCQLQWQDFGDPSNKDSNLYFHQTQISVKGKPKALADITEEDISELQGDEYEAWERAHIQIYIGQPKK